MNVEPVRKDPRTVEDFGINWSSRVGSLTITASEWVAPDGIDIIDDSFTNTTTTAEFSGGTDGEDYEALNTVTLSNDQTAIQALVVQVRAVESWGLTDPQIVTIAEITQETYETIAPLIQLLNGSQVAALISEITLWNANRNSLKVELNGVKEDVSFKPRRLLDEIRVRVRNILGLSLYSESVQPTSGALLNRFVF